MCSSDLRRPQKGGANGDIIQIQEISFALRIAAAPPIRKTAARRTEQSGPAYSAPSLSYWPAAIISTSAQTVARTTVATLARARVLYLQGVSRPECSRSMLSPPRPEPFRMSDRPPLKSMQPMPLCWPGAVEMTQTHTPTHL